MGYNANLADPKACLIVRKFMRPVKGRKNKELVLRAFIGKETEAGNYTGSSYRSFPILDRRGNYDATKCADRNACWVGPRLIRLRDGADITPEEENAS